MTRTLCLCALFSLSGCDLFNERLGGNDVWDTAAGSSSDVSGGGTVRLRFTIDADDISSASAVEFFLSKDQGKATSLESDCTYYGDWDWTYEGGSGPFQISEPRRDVYYDCPFSEGDTFYFRGVNSRGNCDVCNPFFDCGETHSSVVREAKDAPRWGGYPYQNADPSDNGAFVYCE